MHGLALHGGATGSSKAASAQRHAFESSSWSSQPSSKEGSSRPSACCNRFGAKPDSTVNAHKMTVTLCFQRFWSPFSFRRGTCSRTTRWSACCAMQPFTSEPGSTVNAHRLIVSPSLSALLEPLIFSLRYLQQHDQVIRVLRDAALHLQTRLNSQHTQADCRPFAFSALGAPYLFVAVPAAARPGDPRAARRGPSPPNRTQQSTHTN